MESTNTEIQTNPVAPMATDTLAQMASILHDPELAMMADPNFDPAKFIGDVRGKVDGIHFYHQIRMPGTAAFLKGMAQKFAKPLESAAKTISNNCDRLEQYVVDCMLGRTSTAVEKQRLEKLPGNSWRLDLRDNQPSLRITDTATAELKEKYPDLVTIERSYRFDNDAVKSRLKALMTVDDEQQLGMGVTFKHPDVPFAELTQGHHIRFYANVPDDLKPKKKASKKNAKPKAIDVAPEAGSTGPDQDGAGSGAVAGESDQGRPAEASQSDANDSDSVHRTQQEPGTLTL